MAIYYKLYQEKREGAKYENKWYARAKITGQITLRELSKKIEENVSVKESDVYAVLIELVNVMRDELLMSHSVKAVYLLFLRHPEGIVLKCLPDYRKELTALYLLLRPYGLTDRVVQSIENVTNPTLNSINEKCARIRKVFSDLLPKSVARYYAISGKRGEAKKIDLVRANVVWKCKIPVPQGL